MASGLPGFSTSVASGRLRKLREKNPSKNDIPKNTTKNWRTVAFGPTFGLFVWQVVKEAFKFSDSSLLVPVIFCFDVIFGVPHVPLGCEERCMYQTWGKRLY